MMSYKNLIDIDSKCEFVWRSGVKHDCSKVMEFLKKDNNFINGFNKAFDLPDDYIYPMYKSSSISKKNLLPPTKYMMITQKKLVQRPDISK